MDEDSSFSVVGKACFPDVDADKIAVGEVYSIRYMRKRYRGRVAAIGTSVHRYTCTCTLYIYLLQPCIVAVYIYWEKGGGLHSSNVSVHVYMSVIQLQELIRKCSNFLMTLISVLHGVQLTLHHQTAQVVHSAQFKWR